MPSVMLNLATKYLFWPLLILSLVVLYRGHNLPGGGFIGGLIAAFPFILIMLAAGVDVARAKLKVSPMTLIVMGLSVATFSSMSAWFAGETFMTGLWLPEFTLPMLGKMHLGTPLVFDIGVYLAVVGFCLTVIFQLEEIG